MKRIAVDIDGVLANLTKALLEFYNQKNGTNFKEEDLCSFNFGEALGLTLKEERQLVISFFETDLFKNVQPYEDSQDAIKKLSEKNHLSIITARPQTICTETTSWLKNFYSDVFSEIHFTSHRFSENESFFNKSDFCLKFNYGVMIEDYVNYANDCAEKGIESILLTRPWNKNEFLHPQVKRAENWQEILEILK